ncbi:MAG TPA: HEPN family nuclease [Ignavibacteriaceae bacterium]|nr:HEPN family nuclease [Ignavibacteriaceae bacterium]
MSIYLQQEYDFIERTKKIIKQYETIKEKEKYEVTLLLNCFVGLLILPQQYWYEHQPETIISEKDWGISPEHIIFIKKEEIKNVKNVVRHLRNAISHYHFVAFSDDNKSISHIKFEDYDMSSNKTFEATLSVENINKFVGIFSEHMLRLMAASRQT